MIVKNRINRLEIIAIFSCLGMIAWLATDFYGGMMIYLFQFAPIILLIIFLYIISFVDFICSLKNHNWYMSRIKLIAHSLFFSSVLAFNLYHSEILKSPSILIAVAIDDTMSKQRLVFRKNGIVENKIHGIFGHSERINGKYKIHKDLIIFSEKPYDNNFLPDTLLIDKYQEALFITKNKKGEFNTEKNWINHFKIKKMNLGPEM